MALNHLLGDFALKLVGWVFLLPNHNYLHFFSWVPIASYFIWYYFKSSLNGNYQLLFSGLFSIAGIFFFLAGLAQLYRAFLIPIGLIPLWVSIVFLRQSYRIGRAHWNSSTKLQNLVTLVLGPMILIAISGIYNQPWSLVAHLPNISNATLKDLDLRGLNFNLLVIEDSDISGTDFSGSEIRGATFKNAVLDGVNFSNADMSNIKTDGTSLKNTNFYGVRLYQAEIKYSDLSDSNFVTSTGGRLFILDSEICGANFESSSLNVYRWDGSTYDDSTKFSRDTAPEGVVKVDSCN